MKKFLKILLKTVLITVISIIALVLFLRAAVTVDIFSTKTSNYDFTILRFNAINDFIELYVNEHKKMPKNLEVIVSEGYLEKKYTIDVWDTPIRYTITKNGYTLFSCGRDKKLNTSDDVYIIMKKNGKKYEVFRVKKLDIGDSDYYPEQRIVKFIFG